MPKQKNQKKRDRKSINLSLKSNNDKKSINLLDLNKSINSTQIESHSKKKYKKKPRINHKIKEQMINQ